MPIKTRESLRTIKTFDRAKSIAEKAKGGANEVKEYAEDMQNLKYESENEYAGNQVQTTEERAANNIAYGASRFGNWGIRETRRNIQRWKNRPQKLKVEPQKQLPSPQRKALLPGQKQTAKTAKNGAKKGAENAAKTTAKATKKAAKETVKASKKAAQAAKKAAEVTVKAVKVAVKAIIAAVKATVAAIKGIVAAIAAGGWIAVVVILLICIVALVVGWVFGIFISDESSESSVTIASTIRSAERDFYAQIEDMKAEYTYDMCYTTGEPCDASFAIAVYAVKENQTTEVATFDEAKAEILRNIYLNLNTVIVRPETVTETETHLETQSDGTTITVETEVTREYLYVDISPYSISDAISLYEFDNEEAKKLQELLSDDYAEMWETLIE